MSKLWWVFALAGALLAEPQPGAGILIQQAPGTKTKNAREADAIDRLINRLADLIQEAIPCSKPSTTQDVRDALKEAREQELLGNTPNAELAKVLEKVGVRDVVSVDATEMGGQIVLNVMHYDMKTVSAAARDMATVSGDDASIDAFAEKFAGKMKAQPRFAASGNCPADKEWYGSIRATVNKSVDSKSERNRCQETVKGTETWRYTIRIPRRGPPSGYVAHRRVDARHTVCKRQVMCGQTVGDEVSTTEQLDQMVGAGNVRTRVDTHESGGKLYTGVAMDMLTVERTLEGSSHYGGACTKETPPKESKAPPVKMPFPVSGFLVPPQPVNPGQKLVQGSSGDKETTVSWRLTRSGSVQK